MPDTDALIATFGRLGEVQGRLGRRLGADLEARCGLPHVWFEVLVRLSRSDGGQLPMGELADAVTLTTGGMTRLVDRLEAAGFVERRPCSSDRRVSFAAITTAGRRALRTASAVHGANLQEVFADFSPRELAVLDRLLTRLATVQL